MHPALTATDHRPWPLPTEPWIWRQNWLDLAFLHWPVAAAELRKFIPAEIEIQEFAGTAWVGVVPFQMTGVMRRPLPDLPGFSDFPEVNVRTYVVHRGRPGVWFLSLDAPNRAAVWGARRAFGVPYHHASIDFSKRPDGSISFDATRRSDQRFQFRARYEPSSPVYFAAKGSIDHWLAERYCLYSERPGKGCGQVEVHHKPWPLQSAKVEIASLGLLERLGLKLLEAQPLAHFSSGVNVVSFPWKPAATDTH